MREIEFRGKITDSFMNKYDGKWVYGWLSKSVCPEQYHIGGTIKDYGKCEKVITETIGQYTGLKDKNGTKIFEGDIVIILCNSVDVFSAKKDELAIVQFGDKFCQFELNYFNKEWADNECLGNFRDGNCEVIGNIYDNPELLEVDNVKN